MSNFCEVSVGPTEPNQEERTGLEPVEIAGIVFGVIAAVVLSCLIVYFIVKYRGEIRHTQWLFQA